MSISIEWLINKAKKKIYPVSHSDAILCGDNSDKKLTDILAECFRKSGGVLTGVPIFGGGVGDNEGGEVQFRKPQTSTKFSGNITMDIVSNLVRIFATHDGITKQFQIDFESLTEGNDIAIHTGNLKNHVMEAMRKGTIRTLPTPSGEGNYIVDGADSTFPYMFGFLEIRHGANGNEYTATFKTTGTDNRTYYNTWLTNATAWTGWRTIPFKDEVLPLDGSVALKKKNNNEDGGQLLLEKPTNADASGDLAIDFYSPDGTPYVRFFENAHPFRDAYINLSECAGGGSGLGSKILHTGNSAAVKIQESAPSDTSALWVW